METFLPLQSIHELNGIPEAVVANFHPNLSTYELRRPYSSAIIECIKSVNNN